MTPGSQDPPQHFLKFHAVILSCYDESSSPDAYKIYDQYRGMGVQSTAERPTASECNRGHEGRREGTDASQSMFLWSMVSTSHLVAEDFCLVC